MTYRSLPRAVALLPVAGRGNDNAKRGALRAFINLVNAQSGKVLSQADAAVLAALAQGLM